MSSDETATEERDQTLNVLLIEDNPGDARLIREMLRDADELPQRVDPAKMAGKPPELHHETRLEGGLTHLESHAVDAVLLDLNLPDSEGIETLHETLETTDELPVVVLTGLRDRDVGIQAIERGAQDYLVKDEVTNELLIRSIHHAIERNRQERERERRREQLETINQLNEISQDITHLVITTSTREELEQRVCERLVESDTYRFAWFGELKRGGTQIVSRVSAGVEEDYLDEVTITADDTETAGGPAGKAVETHEVQLAQDIETDPSFEPWREQARERGYRSSAAVPVVYDGLLYGLLNIYAPDANAFSGPEVEILAGLGDIVGHAIAALERKDALASDSTLELEFQADGIATTLVQCSQAHDQGTIRLDRLLQKDDSLLAYGSASEIPQEEFVDAATEDEWIEHVRVLTRGQNEYEFEIRTANRVSLVELLATHGGRIASATIEEGELRFVAELPRGVDARRMIDVIEGECPSADYVAQRTASRSDDTVADYDSLLERQLTAKQQEALETAVFAGYFDWPRSSTGEEVAERLGISPATFTQHLRTAERKVFEVVFDR